MTTKTKKHHTKKEQWSPKVSHALVQTLEALDVQTIFGYPGNYVLPLFDALYDSSLIDLVLTRHEQGAVHAADGFARASDKVGVAITTSGPGATNAVTGIATAYADSVPLVILTGQVPTHLIGTDAFQESDIFGITMPVVKHSYLLRPDDDPVYVIQEAFKIASTGRPGPVLIDIPYDVMQLPFIPKKDDYKVLDTNSDTGNIDKAVIEQAACLIAHAQRPLLICGGGCIVSHAEDELTSLLEKRSIPFVVTLMAKGILPEDHPNYLGFIGRYASDWARSALKDADLLIAVGVRFSNRIEHENEYSFEQTDIIHIDIDPAELDKIYRSSCSIAGDARIILHQINDCIKRDFGASLTNSTHFFLQSSLNGDDPHFNTVQDQITEGEQKDTHLSLDPYTSIYIPHLFMYLSKRIDPKRSIILTDVGQHQIWAALYIYRSHPHTFISPGGLGTMGFGLPAAVGASLAMKDSTIICITGDGSFQMNIQEMITAQNRGCGIKVVMLNNSALGLVRSMQKNTYHKRYIATDLDDNPSFSLLAQGYGWGYGCAHSHNDAEYEIDHMLSYEGNYFLELVIDKDDEIITPHSSHFASL